MCKKTSTNMRQLVLEAGGLIQGSENKKSWLARIARQTGLSRRSVSAAFYGEIRGSVHSAGVEARLRAFIGSQKKAEADDLSEIKRRIAALERRLMAGDAEFNQPHIDAHREILRVAGGEGDAE